MENNRLRNSKYKSLGYDSMSSLLRNEILNVKKYLTNGKPYKYKFGKSSYAIKWINYSFTSWTKNGHSQKIGRMMTIYNRMMTIFSLK